MTEPSPPPSEAVPAPLADARRRRAMRGGTIAAAVVLVLLALGAGRTVLSRLANAKVLDQSSAEHAVQYVKTTFAKGASLKDPSGLFNSSLEGGTRRAIDFHEGDKLDERALKALIRAAVALNKSSARG